MINWKFFNVFVSPYYLMPNHLFVEISDGNLSKGMRLLDGVYTQRYKVF